MKYRLIAVLAACAAMCATDGSAQYYRQNHRQAYGRTDGRPHCHARQLARAGYFDEARQCRIAKRAWRQSMGMDYGRGGRYRTADYQQEDNTQPAYGSAQSNQLAQYMDQMLAADSPSWFVNRYIAGSVTNAGYKEFQNGEAVVSANYRYYGPTTNNATGFVQVHLSDGTFKCIEFTDLPGCRALNASPGAQYAMESMLKVLAEWYFAD